MLPISFEIETAFEITAEKGEGGFLLSKARSTTADARSSWR